MSPEDGENVLVVLFLLGTHIHTKDLLHLGGERLLHIFFDSSEQERFKDFVEALITIFSSFAVFVFKILPGVKPDNRYEAVRVKLENQFVLLFSASV